MSFTPQSGLLPLSALTLALMSSGLMAQTLPTTSLKLTVAAAQAANPNLRADYDLDNDGLIEINSLADLNEIRNNLDGKTLYGSSAGCPATGCNGFELTRTLDFDTNADGKLDAQDSYWNEGKGWLPIGNSGQQFGVSDQPFTARFDGNGYQIRNLMINRNEQFGGTLGLFGWSQNNALSNLGLTGPLMSISGFNSVGSLVGTADNVSIKGCYASGTVNAEQIAGGLVGGGQKGLIEASFTSGVISSAKDGVGGLVGINDSIRLNAAFSVAKMSSTNLGLVAKGNSNLAQSSYWLANSPEMNPAASGKGLSLSQLQCPTVADNSTCVTGALLYPGWAAMKDAQGKAYWDFGSAQQLPGLVLNGKVYRDSDGDGVLDNEDAFPLNRAASIDADGDGAVDSWNANCDSSCQTNSGLTFDQFPSKVAAAVDLDFDAMPDRWNSACDSACQTASGLVLDTKPKDADNDGVLDAVDPDHKGVIDADKDHNGLIDIENLAQLDAIRNDLSGSSRKLTATAIADDSGCPKVMGQFGFKSNCIGYELKSDLDFDTNSDGKIDSKDTYWNKGDGWLPIGDGFSENKFKAIFNGNYHVIRNLMINRPTTIDVGLFADMMQGKLQNIGLSGKAMSITGKDSVGALVGSLREAATIQASYSTGVVKGESGVGGLVGNSSSQIQDSFTTGSVEGSHGVGGLIGVLYGSAQRVFSTAQVKGVDGVGGLVGGVASNDAIAESYAVGRVIWEQSASRKYTGQRSYWAAGSSIAQVATEDSDLGLSLAQLQCPTAANNTSCYKAGKLYENWASTAEAQRQAYWNFGSASQLPGLVLNGVVYRDNDADGVLDSDDAFPNNPTVSQDTDADGFADRWNDSCDAVCRNSSSAIIDQFPTNAAVSQDNDQDGLPDAWNSRCDLACQTASNLKLDTRLNDADNDGIVDSQDADQQSLADADHNGLIDIRTLAQLDAIRYNLSGSGRKMTAAASLDSSGCPKSKIAGSLQAECWGYELKANLDFDTNADGKVDQQDQYWNGGAGWLALGDDNQAFSTLFEGNGFRIRNLMLYRPNQQSAQGLFGVAKQATIRNLGLIGPALLVSGSKVVGGLVGRIEHGTITGCYVTGSVRATGLAGGLVGELLSSSLTRSFSTGVVHGRSSVGGLVGYNTRSRVEGVFSTAEVYGAFVAGALIGDDADYQNYYTGHHDYDFGVGSLNAAYATGKVTQQTRSGSQYEPNFAGKVTTISSSYWPTDVLGNDVQGGGQGVTLKQLQCPTSANNSQCAPAVPLYEGWDKLQDAQGNGYWDFGGANQLPGLRLNGVVYRDSDGDGALDTDDAFPNNAAASQDRDADGRPDRWTASCDQLCQQASGLVLDKQPVQVLLHHRDGGNLIMQFAGAQLTEQWLSETNEPEWHLAGQGDFNADGATDLLWYNQLTGDLYLYLMKNGELIESGSLQSAPNLDWQIQVVADLNADHQADLVWRNRLTGETVVWLLAGLDYAKSHSVSYTQQIDLPAVAEMSWQLVGSGDFNGDGTADLYWHNVKTGENYLYFMNNGYLRWGANLFRVTDTNWQVAALGDFNADGKTDMYWRNQKTGDNYVILMNGAAILAEADAPKVADLNWQIVASGDFDADGKTDLFWRNKDNGNNYLFLLDGLKLRNDYPLPSVADTAWTVGAVLTSH